MAIFRRNGTVKTTPAPVDYIYRNTERGAAPAPPPEIPGSLPVNLVAPFVVIPGTVPVGGGSNSLDFSDATNSQYYTTIGVL